MARGHRPGETRRPALRLRFHLKNGSLYAFWFSPDASGASHGYVAAGGPGFTSNQDTVGLAALRPAPATPRARRVLYNFDGDSCLSTKAGGQGPAAVSVDDVKKKESRKHFEDNFTTNGWRDFYICDSADSRNMTHADMVMLSLAERLAREK